VFITVRDVGKAFSVRLDLCREKAVDFERLYLLWSYRYRDRSLTYQPTHTHGA
jgi:hypothetical protein